MPNIPSPISETSEESYFPEPRKVEAPNFSRPQPGRSHSHAKLQRDAGDRTNAHTISAFYEPNRDLPDEPRFSLDSEQTTSTSDNSAASEFAWDGELGELRSKRRPKTFDQQRVSMESQRRAAQSSSTTSRTTTRHPPVEIPAAAPTNSSSASKSSRRPANTKKVSFDRQSERARASEDQYEDNKSHHTVSESGDSAGSFDMEGQWQSSDYDYSGLSEAEVRKLKKKGINPALYAEMQAAKKGRNKWISSLSGNTFLS